MCPRQSRVAAFVDSAIPMLEEPLATSTAVGSILRGPQIIRGRDAVNWAEFKGLNVDVPDIGMIRLGETGAAADLQNYLGESFNEMRAVCLAMIPYRCQKEYLDGYHRRYASEFA